MQHRNKEFPEIENIKLIPANGEALSALSVPQKYLNASGKMSMN